YIKGKKFLKGIGLVLSPFIINYAIIFIFQLLVVPFFSMHMANNIYLIVTSFIPSPFMVEGGLFLIITGILLYMFRENRILQFIYNGIFTIAWMICIPLIFIRLISLIHMFTNY